MKKYKRLGIYGGTFAPVHNGHTQSAKAFIESGIIDSLIVMPALIPPHKKMSFEDSPAARLDMLKIAFCGFSEYGSHFEISDYEISKGDISYTYKTANHFKPMCEKLVLLCGSDMLLSFDSWYRAKELMQMCEVAYIPRHYDDISSLRSKAERLNREYGLITHEIKSDIIEISSSDIRQMIKENRDITDFVDINVAKYIKENGLYV